MKKWMTVLAVAAVLTAASPAKALRIAIEPVGQRVARADAVVVGKVTEVAEKAEKAEMFKNDERMLKIATVKVDDAVLGKKKTLKVGYFDYSDNSGGIRPGRPRLGGGGGVTLTKDTEAMLFLAKHPTKKDLYVVQGFGDVVLKTGNDNFAAEKAEAVKAAKRLKDAKKGLDSKDKAERLETVALLVTRYKTQPASGSKTEDVPAAESKKILETLADAEWAAGSRFDQTNAQSIFFRLGIQPTDGWKQPRDFTQVPEEAKKWLKDNAGKYKMKRFVRADDKADATEPE